MKKENCTIKISSQTMVITNDGAAGSASVSDSGFVFVLLSFISFLVCI